MILHVSFSKIHNLDSLNIEEIQMPGQWISSSVLFAEEGISLMFQLLEESISHLIL